MLAETIAEEFCVSSSDCCLSISPEIIYSLIPTASSEHSFSTGHDKLLPLVTAVQTTFLSQRIYTTAVVRSPSSCIFSKKLILHLTFCPAEEENSKSFSFYWMSELIKQVFAKEPILLEKLSLCSN